MSAAVVQWFARIGRERSEAERAAVLERSRLEFLPAALEIQDTPPNPMARKTLWTVVALFVIAVIWACWAQVDIVVTARGKVVPSGRVKTVQPFEGGVVRAILVRDGQLVTMDQPLIELDTALTAADEARVAADLATVRADLVRLKALEAALSRGKAPLATGLPLQQAALLRDQWAEFVSRRSTLEQDIQRLTAAREGARQTVARLEATQPLIDERVANLEKLTAESLAPRQQLLELKQEQVAVRYERETQKARLNEVGAELARAQEQRRGLEAEFGRGVQEQLVQAETRLSGLTQEGAKAGERARLQTLRAPADGIVKALAVHTVGGVVTPAQELLQVVPIDDVLEIEALVENQDIGFVRAGQTVEVKVDAFPFTKFGLIEGDLASISADAVALEDGPLVYPVRVVVRREAQPKEITLAPGMTTAVEIKTGTRRVIEFLLAPVVRKTSESLSER